MSRSWISVLALGGLVLGLLSLALWIFATNISGAQSGRPFEPDMIVSELGGLELAVQQAERMLEEIQKSRTHPVVIELMDEAKDDTSDLEARVMRIEDMLNSLESDIHVWMIEAATKRERRADDAEELARSQLGQGRTRELSNEFSGRALWPDDSLERFEDAETVSFGDGSFFADCP